MGLFWIVSVQGLYAQLGPDITADIQHCMDRKAGLDRNGWSALDYVWRRNGSDSTIVSVPAAPPTTLRKGAIFISKKQMMLTLFDPNGNALLSYPIACGLNSGDKQKANDMRTPEGCFVVERIQNSSYWTHNFRDGKGVIHGAYGDWFIRLKTSFQGIGIHGTHLPESIGTRSTEGCIRLNNDSLNHLRSYVHVGMYVFIGSDDEG